MYALLIKYDTNKQTNKISLLSDLEYTGVYKVHICLRLQSYKKIYYIYIQIYIYRNIIYILIYASSIM